MVTHRFSLVFVAILSALGAGCHCPRTCVEMQFPGLRTELNQASTNNGTLRLLIVHGMSTHTQGYSSNFVDEIARRLKINQVRTEVDVLKDSNGKTNGYLTMTDLARNETNRLRAYELTWSPATSMEKMDRFEFDSRLDGKRASLNRQAKSTLLNDGFADAVLYLNDDFRPKIQAPVTNAILRILGTDFRTNDLCVIVTHSLGSKLTFDCLNIVSEQVARTKNVESQALTNLAAGLSYLIMFANQVPLLRLGETNVSAQPLQPKTSAVQKFLDTRRQGLEQRKLEREVPTKPTLRVIAVSDPNDLLSYPLQRTDLITDESSDIEFGNLFICNVPAFLGWVANPVKAHERYFDNPKLVKLLIQGYNKKPKVCLKEPPARKQ